MTNWEIKPRCTQKKGGKETKVGSGVSQKDTWQLRNKKGNTETLEVTSVICIRYHGNKVDTFRVPFNFANSQSESSLKPWNPTGSTGSEQTAQYSLLHPLITATSLLFSKHCVDKEPTKFYNNLLYAKFNLVFVCVCNLKSKGANPRNYHNDFRKGVYTTEHAWASPRTSTIRGFLIFCIWCKCTWKK